MTEVGAGFIVKGFKVGSGMEDFSVRHPFLTFFLRLPWTCKLIELSQFSGGLNAVAHWECFFVDLLC